MMVISFSVLVVSFPIISSVPCNQAEVCRQVFSKMFQNEHETRQIREASHLRKMVIFFSQLVLLENIPFHNLQFPKLQLLYVQEIRTLSDQLLILPYIVSIILNIIVDKYQIHTAIPVCP
uniref:Putative secreted protein n=1 Tax=Panstrongylus lignarius TaxID=156445 RepID=A0A224Y0F9_9HEMI